MFKNYGRLYDWVLPHKMAQHSRAKETAPYLVKYGMRFPRGAAPFAHS